MIDRLIERLPNLGRAQLAGMRIKGMHRRNVSPEDKEIHRFIDAIDSEFLRRKTPPHNGWTTGVHGDPRYLMCEGQRVGVVQRMETHRHSNGDVYLAEVLGQFLPEQFRRVDDARLAVERAFSGNLQKISDQPNLGKRLM
ncbi:hypothetical protein [Roseovarius nanhaiticus]|uniref:hypothetical protein n=1 Tax=Roseovarius nanhaiticus TaxID=573024 RepID=UPI00248F7713|nr:hypothetical protein [Roseovarius nanhaiticus]